MKAEGIIRSAYAEIEPFVTKDGAVIRELMHPARHGNRAQSLAEATVAPGMKTALHRHRTTEEIYQVTHGRGSMTLGRETFDVGPGDTVCIPPGTPHCIENTGRETLYIVCACAPAYSDTDTDLL